MSSSSRTPEEMVDERLRRVEGDGVDALFTAGSTRSPGVLDRVEEPERKALTLVLGPGRFR